ncbi:DUF624 domain-containing protein [Microbacterium gilvum]|uniref:DUF624 domain-containing protein n=1 Tax=Microbacterium gilvum TaxID=1336204 RepID=A0ABP9AKX8_9MICO
MKRLLAVHLRLVDVVLRLVRLNLLWWGWTLRGVVVAGAFPATAALAAVARRDAIDGVDDDRAGWRALRREFAAARHAEARQANALGWMLAGAVALLVVEERLVRALGGDAFSTFVGGMLWMLVVLVLAIGVTAWPLGAHFDERPLAIVRRSALLLAGRPVAALVHLAVFAGVLCAYYLAPGLIPVFGLAAPMWLATGALWGTGVLPRRVEAVVARADTEVVKA